MIHNNENGFTLVELLVSILIFAIGVAALTQTLVTTIRGNNLGNRETAAMTLGYDKLEELRGIDPSSFDTHVKLLAGTHNTVAQGAYLNVAPNIFGGVTTVTASGGYSVTYNVTDLTTSGALFYNKAKQVDVTVSWQDPQPHTVSISSVLVPNI